MAGMSPEAEAAFDALMADWGEDLHVNSGYRSPEHNARVGGAKHSQHIHGNAKDMDVSHLSTEQRIDLINMAKKHGLKGVGVYDNALHFDIGPERAWGADYTKGSLPEEYAFLLDGSTPSAGHEGHGHETALGSTPQQDKQPHNALSLGYTGLDASTFMNRRT